MDDKDLQLYQEEQRQLLIDVSKALSQNNKLMTELIEKYKQPSDHMEVSGEVTVNTEKKVEVTNIDSINFKQEASDIAEAVKSSRVDTVTVKNIKDAIPRSVEVSNQKDYSEDFVNVVEAIKNNKTEVNVEKQDIKLPNTPRDYISVRLTDGKKFYQAMAAVTNALQGLPLVTSTKTGGLALAVANADGTPIEGGGTTPVDTDNLLLENGDAFLLENGDQLLLESA